VGIRLSASLERTGPYFEDTVFPLRLLRRLKMTRVKRTTRLTTRRPTITGAHLPISDDEDESEAAAPEIPAAPDRRLDAPLEEMLAGQSELPEENEPFY
jgi:hypothetical protein